MYFLNLTTFQIADIRKANRLFDNNIIARSTLIIPNYVGPSLSEKHSEEEEKKMLVKRFQVRSKCIDPIEARFYMEQSNYNIENGRYSLFFYFQD